MLVMCGSMCSVLTNLFDMHTMHTEVAGKFCGRQFCDFVQNQRFCSYNFVSKLFVSLLGDNLAKSQTLYVLSKIFSLCRNPFLHGHSVLLTMSFVNL